MSKEQIKNAGTSINEETYFVFYGDHDSGSDSKGFMVRQGYDTARRTEDLMYQCGYRRIEVKSALDMLEL